MDRTKIGGAAKQVYAGPAGIFAVHPKSGDIYRYSGDIYNPPGKLEATVEGILGKDWARVGGPGSMFRPGTKLWGLSPDKQAVMEWSGTGDKWTKIGGPANHLYAGDSSLFGTDPKSGDIYRYSGQPNRWSRVGGPGATFAVLPTDGQLFGLSPDKQTIWSFVDDKPIGGPAEKLYGTGKLLAVYPGGDVYAYSGFPHNPNAELPLPAFNRIGGPGSDFVGSSRSVFALSPDKSGVWRNETGKWERVSGPAKAIASFTPPNSSPEVLVTIDAASSEVWVESFRLSYLGI